MAKLNIVLYEPEIPQNTGNIARLWTNCLKQTKMLTFII